MYFLATLILVLIKTDLFFLFLYEKIKHATMINQELIFSSFFCISLNPREKETKKTKKTNHRYGQI
jgi:hypothetical protein